MQQSFASITCFAEAVSVHRAYEEITFKYDKDRGIITIKLETVNTSAAISMTRQDFMRLLDKVFEILNKGGDGCQRNTLPG